MTAPASRAAGMGAGGRLLWSEHVYLLAAVIAAFFTLDLVDWGIVNRAAVRHLALAVSLVAWLLTLTGRKMRSPPGQRATRTARVLRATWPFCVLALLIVGGSLYARFAGGIQNTFLVVGLYMLVAPCAAAMMLQTEAPDALLRAYFRILLAAAVVMSLGLVAYFGVTQVYHEQIFFVIPMAALFFAQDRRVLVRWTGCIFFLAMAWFSQKYTSYLIGALTVTYLALMVGFPRLDTRSRLQHVTTIYWACVLGLLAAALLAYLARHGVVHLPSGNVDYRSYTYEAAWDRFTESPLWGTLFTAEAVEKFTLYSIGIARNMLPTHSDILDLLANGGVLAVALWIYGLIRAARLAWDHLLHPRFLGHPWAPYGHTLALMTLAGIVTYAFNPILLQPPMAYLLWTNLGMLVGMSLRIATAIPRTDAAGSATAMKSAPGLQPVP